MGSVFDDGTVVDSTPRIIGVVTAYLANRATLPDLAYAQDVSHFHTSTLESLYEAQKKKQLEQEQAQSVSPSPDQTAEQAPSLPPELIPPRSSSCGHRSTRSHG